MTPTLQQIIRNYGDAVALMPRDVAAYYLCYRCADDVRTVRNMRETIIPTFRTSPTFGRLEIAEAVATFESRFPQQVAA